MIPHSGIILLDVGGTFIKCSDGRQVPVNSAGSREEIASSLREAVGDAGRVGVAIPGPFDYEKGIFLMKHKFAAVYGEHFADLVSLPCHSFLPCHSERSEGTSYRFIHDVNAALLGECPTGNTALITIGTGLGFSYTKNGVVQKAASGSPAFSIYNLPWGSGILEDYVSKRGILRTYNELIGGTDDCGSVLDLSLKARAGDALAKQAFSSVAGTLTRAIAPVVKELGISEIIMSGQISKSFDLMEEALKQGFGDGVIVRPSSDISGAVFKGIAKLFDN